MFTLTPQMLKKIGPNMPQDTADDYAPMLTQGMDRWGIDTYDEITMFLANLMHESGEFRWMQEIASGSEYEGRADLGNTSAGDGVKYKGRGPIQVTGKTNYIIMGMLLDLDLVDNPDLLLDPQNGIDAACAFWWNNRLDDAAKKGFIPVVKAINGGTNGLADRQTYLTRARQVIPQF